MNFFSKYMFKINDDYIHKTKWVIIKYYFKYFIYARNMSVYLINRKVNNNYCGICMCSNI